MTVVLASNRHPDSVLLDKALAEPECAANDAVRVRSVELLRQILPRLDVDLVVDGLDRAEPSSAVGDGIVLPPVVRLADTDDPRSGKASGESVEHVITREDLSGQLLAEAIQDVLSASDRSVASNGRRGPAEEAYETALLREAFDQSPSCVAVLNGPEHIFEMANPAYSQLVGDRDLVGRPVREVFPELEGEGYFELLDHVYETGETVNIDERSLLLETTDGMEKHYVTFVYEPRWENGDVVGVLAHGVDVTEQVKSRKRAVESEARLQRAQQVGDMGSWELDFESGDIEWSRQIYRIFGCSPDEVDPDYETFVSFVHSEDRELLERAQEVVLSGREDLDIEHRIVRPDGEIRWVHERGELVHEDGEPVALSGTVQDITERKGLEEELRHRTLHDPLTGLPNRFLFDDRLETSLERARQQGEALTVLMLDVDRFKDINDSLGHTGGDRVLEQVARRLDDCVRESDTVARVGGDEFGLLLEASGGARAVDDITGRIDSALAEPFIIGGERIELTANIGVVRYDPDDSEEGETPETPEDLARYAELSMHRAKEKSDHHVYSFTGDHELGGRLRRERRLERAIEDDEFEPHYQPVVDLGSGEIVGLETLLRWRHPERGLLGPGEFIPLAEESGLIRPLGEELLRNACRDVGRWKREERIRRSLMLAINFSARQLEDEDLPRKVEEILEDESFDPSRLKMEITETAILRAAHGLAPLREQGIQVAIDDFGTGYASYTYLRELEVDGLKLDMSFVQGVGSDERDETICRTVVELGEAFDLSVVAEGIETREQHDRLREMGCPLGQGYLLARPGPAPDVLPLLREGSIEIAS